MQLEQRGRVRRLYLAFNSQEEEAHECSETVLRLSDGSEVRRESHASFCERPEVKPLWPTLHSFDLWAERWRRREAVGDMIIVRYADDIVVGFEHETEARRFWDAMRERLQEFALSLHPDKTRLIEFGRHAAANREKRGLAKPETFTFLGFTLICGKSRRGNFLVKRKTRRDRMIGKIKEVKQTLRRLMHRPIPEQGLWLKQVVTGYFAYHAVPTNSRALRAFRLEVSKLWLRTLRQRSQKDGFTWARITKLIDDWLPKPRILHPWPEQRFAVKYPRRAPYAGKLHVRCCAGGVQ
jgi:RNA-directed DNA polymerase